jgi:hypothetical protein
MIRIPWHAIVTAVTKTVIGMTARRPRGDVPQQLVRHERRLDIHVFFFHSLFTTSSPRE